MVHGLVAQSGGLFTLDSKIGVGTRVELRLPTSDAAPRTDATIPRDVARSTGTGTVLLVDDEDIVREGTTQLLIELGYAVIPVASGAEALAQIRGGAGIDILVTDYLMPQMNGAQLSTEARKLKPGLPILLIRLAKPFRHADLAHRMQELVNAA